jgi:hypothetical protein
VNSLASSGDIATDYELDGRGAVVRHSVRPRIFPLYPVSRPVLGREADHPHLSAAKVERGIPARYTFSRNRDSAAVLLALEGSSFEPAVELASRMHRNLLTG